MKPPNREKHVDYQKLYFDGNVDFFRQPIPAEISQRTREIVALANLSSSMRVLDVGTGVGVLIPYFIDSGIPAEAIRGCDLSAEMLTEARKRHPKVNFWQGDILEYNPENIRFDAIFINACFGNFFDQYAAFRHCAELLASKGKIVISHPLGNGFVGRLKEQDPLLVLSLLPERAQLEGWCDKLNLRIDIFRDETDFYLAILTNHV